MLENTYNGVMPLSFFALTFAPEPRSSPTTERCPALATKPRTCQLFVILYDNVKSHRRCEGLSIPLCLADSHPLSDLEDIELCLWYQSKLPSEAVSFRPLQ